MAAYVGIVPGLKQSGKHRPVHAALVPIGHARLRAALWMPALVATRLTPGSGPTMSSCVHVASTPKLRSLRSCGNC
ncbi:transposase [Nitrospira sp. Nam74]